jgi:Uma2 family endonuclease
MIPATSPPTSAISTPLLTAEEFVRSYGDHAAELVEGVVQELPMPFLQHGKVCGLIAYFLTDYALKHDSAHVMTNDSFVKTRSSPDTIRGPDVCYISFERLPRGPVPKGLLDIIPDLVVEVRSPSETWDRVFGKVGEYLRAGIRVVIVLDEPTQSATVYRQEELQQIYHNGDELAVPDVLPGFAKRLNELLVKGASS